jgi:sulfoxide reductase heme-binding subunit YedZ
VKARVLQGLVCLLCSLPLMLLGAGIAGAGPYDLGADPAREILHRCGLTALQLLLATLCITPLRVVTGQVWLHPLRRTLGLFAFGYAALHLLVWMWLIQGLDIAAMLADVVKRPYITIGVVSVLMLAALAATSTRRAMRRLGRRWQRLHWLVYPATVLGVWHFWWQVKKDIREPLAYAVALGLLLAWRVWRARPTLRPTVTSAAARAPERT